MFNRYEKNHGMNWIRKEKRLAIYLRDGAKCVYCLKPGDLSLDHVKHDGCNDASNLVTACMTCNCEKQEMPISKFASPAVLRRVKTLTSRPVDVAAAKSLIAQRGGYRQAMRSL